MLVGFGVGEEDDKAQRVFIGDAGRKFTYLLGKSGLKRKEIYLTNLVKCFPDKEKPKKKLHIDPCKPYIYQEIHEVRPKVIVVFGEPATKALIGKTSKFKHLVGFPVYHTFLLGDEEFDCWVIPAHSPAAALRQWELDAQIIRTLQDAQIYAKGEKAYTLPEAPYVTIKTIEEARQYLGMLLEQKSIVVDTETLGFRVAKHAILDIGFCYSKDQPAIILPLFDKKKGNLWGDHLPEIKQLVKSVLLNPTSKVGGHNFKFDMRFLSWWLGETLFIPNVFDTMTMHHVLDENNPHNLTFLLGHFFYWDRYDAAMEPYKKTGKDFGDAPAKVRHQYLAYDVLGEFLLYETLSPQIPAKDLETVYQTEVALTNYLLPVELVGIRFNKEKMDELVIHNRDRAIKARARLREIATDFGIGTTEKPFNPNSSQQLAKLLKDAGALLLHKTDTGADSTGKNVLKYLATQPDQLVAEISNLTQELRNANKLLSTYLDGKPVDCGLDDVGDVKDNEDKGFFYYVDDDLRCRPSYNISLTATGRLSATDPAVQTVPRLWGIRSLFVPDNEDSVFLSCDYSKIELCVLAWCANDPVMADELIRGIDLHAKTAITKRLKRAPTEEEFEKILADLVKLPTWKQERAVAKAVSFGTPYNISAKGIVDGNPDAFESDMPVEERIEIAQDMIDAYFERYVQVKEYLDRQFLAAQSIGYLRTYFTKRERRFHDAISWLKTEWSKNTRLHGIDKNNLRSQACNFEIQSTASDELTRATKRVYEGMQKCNIPHFRIVFSLHDQFMFNVHKDHVEEAKPLIRSWMETTFPSDSLHKFEIPFKIDIAVQRWWGDNEY